MLIGRRWRHWLLDHRLRRGRLIICKAANYLISDKSASAQGCFDADNAENMFSDGSRACVGRYGHESRDAVCEVGNVLSGVQTNITVSALTSDQEAVAFLESMDPAGRELGWCFILVARQLRKD
jgi:hypothetical protein